MSPAFSKKYPRARFLTGFTLAEMMTVTAIFLIMTAVVLGNLPEFSDRASLELVAQEVSLVIRQAQSFGANTRATLQEEGTEFPSYGIYFNLNDATSVFPSGTSFRLFADVDGNGRYSDSEATTCATLDAECREVFTLTGGLRIQDLRVCGQGCQVLTDDRSLNIVFARPNPEASFVDSDGVEDFPDCGAACSHAIITLHSARNNQTRDICVWNTGHIYSKAECP